MTSTSAWGLAWGLASGLAAPKRRAGTRVAANPNPSLNPNPITNPNRDSVPKSQTLTLNLTRALTPTPTNQVRYAGQGFRLGRYPIHFHMIGTVRNSYVRGNSIHHTRTTARLPSTGCTTCA